MGPKSSDSSLVSTFLTCTTMCLMFEGDFFLFTIVILSQNVIGINHGIWISIVWAQAGEIVCMYSMYTECRCSMNAFFFFFQNLPGFSVFETCDLQFGRLSDWKWLLIIGLLWP